MIFAKKILPEHFDAILSGEKPFEVRTENADCPYAKGDYLALNEYSATDGYTGDCLLAEITSVLRDPDLVKPGTAILGLRVFMAQTEVGA